MSNIFVRKKNSSQMPTKNKFWSQIKTPRPTKSEQKFQTPHHAPETLIDLTDDKSPHIAGSTQKAVEKTIIKGNLETKVSPIVQKQQNTRVASGGQGSRKNNSSKIVPADEDFTIDVSVESAVQTSMQFSQITQNKPTVEFSSPNTFIVQASMDSLQNKPTSTPLTYLVGKPNKHLPVNSQTVTPVQLKGTNPNQKGMIGKKAKKKNFVQAQPIKQEMQIPKPNPFVRKYPSGIPLSILRQQEMEKLKQIQLAALQQLQQQQQLPQSAIQQQKQLPQNAMEQQQQLPQNAVEQQQLPQNAMQQQQQLPQNAMQQQQQIPQNAMEQQQQYMMPHSNIQTNPINPSPQQTMGQAVWQPQPTFAQEPMVPMQYNVAMPGYDPAPQLFVPPVQAMDQTPQLNAEIYNVNTTTETQSDVEPRDGSVSPDFQTGQRLSAFKRLGPLTQPKKPKLTINLQCNKEQSVREVVERTNEKPEIEPFVPVHMRADILTSTDETVIRFLVNWPWKKPVPIKRTVTAKPSKSAMLLEKEQMEPNYEKDNMYVQISIKGYPPTWKKEDVLDVFLESIYIIPCFVEFNSEECKFLVIRSRLPLLNIHKIGFTVVKDDVVLTLSISITALSLNQIDFIPRLILRKRLAMAYNGEDTLNLKSFTTRADISHFIYFPLNSTVNQSEIVEMQSVVAWEYLTSLDLSHNRMTSIDRFHLKETTPKLRHLDLSHNKLDKIAVLLQIRALPLRSIKLEGNPLCNDYIDPAHYVKVIRMICCSIREIDGIEVQLKGDFPKFHKNYCSYGAEHVVDKFLSVFFPLLDCAPEDRLLIDALYDAKALISITYQHRYLMRQFRCKPVMSRYKDDGAKEVIEGASAMTKTISKWPPLKHDPYTFTVDTLYHSDTSTIIKIDGILKITSETLAEDEHVISFTRTVVLRTRDGSEYKIHNEMLHLHIPCVKYAKSAFQITKVRSKRLSLDLDYTPDDDLKDKLTGIFMKITELDKKASERCLDKKDWNLRNALDYFMQLLKLDDLQALTTDVNCSFSES